MLETTPTPKKTVRFGEHEVEVDWNTYSVTVTDESGRKLTVNRETNTVTVSDERH